MEPKIDGWRMQIDVSDSIQAWTRTNHDASRKLPLVEQTLWRLRSTDVRSFRLDGEAVYVDDEGEPDYNFTARCLGSGTETCIDKQQGGRYLTYFAFDLLTLNGSDLRNQPLQARKMHLYRLLENTESSYVRYVAGSYPTIDRHIKNVERFKEGSVLKLRDSAYAGKRHKSWLKYKEIETVDVMIVGYKMGQGKFENMVGAIGFRTGDGIVGYCSGMDDATRINITEGMIPLLGTFIEIKHYGKLVDGYRHPQFVRFRPDKVSFDG
jgi:bifunctional non-homologous end joining protein LigD